jgi:hypothetical protein
MSLEVEESELEHDSELEGESKIKSEANYQ